ncbi:MAG: hypothetical protein FWD29_01160 [Micrococcales bacterium]|nr:hypothetical protein [Micrococcales bacterium]
MRKIASSPLVLVLSFGLALVAGCGSGTGDNEVTSGGDKSNDKESTDTAAETPPQNQLILTEPLEPVEGPGTVVQERLDVTINVDVPAGWTAYLDSQAEDLYILDGPKPTDDARYQGITIGIKLSSTDVFFTPSDATPIDSQTIGGIEMEGHFVVFGDDINNYIGQTSDGLWVNVFVANSDLSNTEAAAIVDSIKFIY